VVPARLLARQSACSRGARLTSRSFDITHYWWMLEECNRRHGKSTEDHIRLDSFFFWLIVHAKIKLGLQAKS
jgi:hypothetical protein